ncbi:hypothetical protein ILUMI_19705 [Ignelater luminosus]|uniref:Uncharacterized protein n=1 Tax=Ignelater luminosus TaxID=2038154 RepID=A0A8K0G5L1_IGNLU|nr:hypothetical protein ILUMI_19705 [Ignelater luminosus]
MIQNEDLLKIPLYFLKFSGQHPDSDRLTFIFATTAFTILSSVILGFVFLHFVLSFGDPFLFLKNVGGFGVYVQVWGKVIIGAAQKDRLAKIIKDSKHFWNITKCPDELKNTFQMIFSTILRLQKLFLYMTIVTITIANIQAYLSKQLTLGIWLIEGHDIYYRFQYGIQAFTLLYVVVTQIVPMDQIFMTMCMMLIAQFMLLNHKLRNLCVRDIINEEDKARYIRNMVSYIKYHQFLLRYFKDLATTYAPVLLNEYISLITALCSAMITMLEG